MKSRPHLFNGFLALTIFTLLTGCMSSEERKRALQYSSLRIHVESDRGSADRSSAIAIHRANPIYLNIDREAVLDESNVAAAMVIDQPGGFSIEVKFDRRGSWILERTTVMNRGKHLAIFSDFGDHKPKLAISKTARWLAAPEIIAKNSSGHLVFTPDATREEAERIVHGLNNVAKKIEGKEWIPWAQPVDR
jgi:hypothetical protein